MKQRIVKPFLKIAILTVSLGVAIYITQDKVTLKELFIDRKASVTGKAQERFEIIELPEALRLFNAHNAVFLDARLPRYYDYGHIENAINIASESIREIPEDTLFEWRNSSSIVIYCNGTTCGDAFSVARGLLERNFDNIKIYIGGWPEWRSCGLPISMSKQMKNDTTGGSN